MDGQGMDREAFARMLEEIARTRMPFGRYGPERYPPEGLPLDELPLEYLQWFLDHGGGFPKSRLGQLMRLVYEAKSTGMDEVFQLGRMKRGGRTPRRRRRRSREFGDGNEGSN